MILFYVLLKQVHRYNTCYTNTVFSYTEFVMMMFGIKKNVKQHGESLWKGKSVHCSLVVPEVVTR